MAAIIGYKQYDCVEFLNCRIECENYRGVQISQHNRYDIDIIHTIIDEMFKVCGCQKLQIRTTDLSKRPYNIEGEENYATLVKNIANKIGRCTQDSLRKNFFVDMHRMGLIERYDFYGNHTNPYKQSRIKYVSLTPLARGFIESTDIFEKRMMYTMALESLMSGYGETIANIMVDLDMTKITAVEMALFTSFVGQSLSDKIVTIGEIELLLNEFHQLSVYQQRDIVEKLQLYCKKTMSCRNKNDKRDWHNWLNESQQVLNLLGQTSFFEQCGNDLIIRSTEDGVFANGRLKRSKIEREKYYIEHEIKKKIGFELHHIVPLCWAKNREQFLVLDHWKNLVYIDAYSHAKITQQHNKNVVLNFINKDMILSDFHGNEIECVSDENIVYKLSLQETMKAYNKSILNSSNNMRNGGK